MTLYPKEEEIKFYDGSLLKKMFAWHYKFYFTPLKPEERNAVKRAIKKVLERAKKDAVKYGWSVKKSKVLEGTETSINGPLVNLYYIEGKINIDGKKYQYIEFYGDVGAGVLRNGSSVRVCMTTALAISWRGFDVGPMGAIRKLESALKEVEEIHEKERRKKTRRGRR